MIGAISSGYPDGRTHGDRDGPWVVAQAMTDFTEWMTEVAAQPGPSEERLDQLRADDGIDDLTDTEAAAWLVKVIADYRRKPPAGWEVHVVVGRTGPERTGTNSVNGRLTHIATAIMDQAQTLADTTRRPVKVIHGVDGNPQRFLRTLAKYGADMNAFTSPVWTAVPAPLPRADHKHARIPEAFRGVAPVTG